MKHARKRQVISVNRLRQLLYYDPDLGWFMWLETRGRIHAGDFAGSVVEADGRIRIRIDGEEYKAHRLAYFYMTSEWPSDEIDHQFGVKDDNRWTFLRPANRSENMQNQRKAHRDSMSGLLGASWYARTNRWRAVISIRMENNKKKVVSLGYFPNRTEAHLAYLAAKAKYHKFQTLVNDETRTAQAVNSRRPKKLSMESAEICNRPPVLRAIPSDGIRKNNQRAQRNKTLIP